LEHRDFWEEILVEGMSEGYLLSLGRFYLLKREDHSNALCVAIRWHNKMIVSMKAIIIRGISNSIMDAGVKPPHDDEQRPTLRQKIHTGGGFITIISTPEANKWIGIAKNAATATHFINTDMRDLCAAIYSDGTAPSASDPDNPIRSTNSRNRIPDSASALFDRQSKSWADVAGQEDNSTSNFTASNIARRPPRNVQFKSKIRFDIQEVVLDNEKTDEEETRTTTNDNMTILTQDDLRTLKEEICAQFKDEISTAISEMSSPTEQTTTNAALQQSITNQIQEHNKEMKETMQAMKMMMLSMQRFVESAMPESKHSDAESSRSDDNSFKEVTNFDHSDIEMAGPPEPPLETLLLTQPSKRRAIHSKGESPDAKRQQPRTKGGRGGRGDAGRHNNRRSSRINHYEPLAMSFEPSSSGSN
jgi:hypothetical protein